MAAGLAEIGLSSRAVPALCRRTGGEGRRGLGARPAELAVCESGVTSEESVVATRSTAGRNSSPSMSPDTSTDGDGKPSTAMRRSGSRADAGDVARMYAGKTVDEEPAIQDEFKEPGAGPPDSPDPSPARRHHEDRAASGAGQPRMPARPGGATTSSRQDSRRSGRGQERRGPRRRRGREVEPSRGRGGNASGRTCDLAEEMLRRKPGNLEALPVAGEGESEDRRCREGPRRPERPDRHRAGTTPRSSSIGPSPGPGSAGTERRWMSWPGSSDRIRRTTPSSPRRRSWPRSWARVSRSRSRAWSPRWRIGPGDPGLRHEAARAFAAASKASPKDPRASGSIRRTRPPTAQDGDR